ncbi:hypothetical protein SteCoe_392 [Stentor coeruleus]|uniref:Uncharacterized protein n=1 Tax=Stentor coeruleus TaxID=5963 RepID=A0A1R2D474_9CILI|nr:hypothetical protein SteCoe_392 [Stentor coeruleus]
MHIKTSQHNLPIIKTTKLRKSTLDPGQSLHSYKSKTQRTAKSSPKNSNNLETQNWISESISEPSTEILNDNLKYSEKTKNISSKVLQSLKLLKSVSSSLINPNISLRSEISEAKSFILSPAPRPNDMLTTSQNYDKRLTQEIYESLNSLKSSIEVLERRVVSAEEMIKLQINEEGNLKVKRLKFRNSETELSIEDNENLVMCRVCNIF